MRIAIYRVMLLLWMGCGLVATLLLCDALHAAKVRRAIRSAEIDRAHDTPRQTSLGEDTCLLVHGFRSSPRDLRLLADFLAESGISSLSMLLPGHGSTVEALSKSRAEDWYRAVVSAHDRLARQHSRVFVFGHSLGGLLALRLAQDRALPGLVVTCPLVLVSSARAGPVRRALGALLYRLPVFSTTLVHHRPPDIRDAELRSQHTSSPFYPLATTASLLGLVKSGVGRLEFVTCPTLIFQARTDRVVDPGGALDVYLRLGADRKQLIWLEHSGHEALLDSERNEVARRIVEFIQGC